MHKAKVVAFRRQLTSSQKTQDGAFASIAKEEEVEGVETKDVDEGEKKEVEGGEEKEVECREKSATSCGNASLLEVETLLEGPTRQDLVRGNSQEALKSAGPAV